MRLLLVAASLALSACSTLHDDASLDQSASTGSSAARMPSGSYCCGTMASSTGCDRRFEQSCAVRNDGRVFQVDVP